MQDLTIKLPHNYAPRSYQLPVFEAYNNGIKRFILVWHRRSGKDTTFLNFTICRMMERVGQYWHIFPTYAQAKKALWEGFSRESMPLLDHFPDQLVKHRDNNDLKITLVNGSIYQLIGSDQVDSIVGTNPIGLIFSEYSIQAPNVYDLLEPIILENGGWTSFIFTPRGRNHAYDLWEKTKNQPTWFRSMKTVEETERDSSREEGGKVVTSEMLEEVRMRGADEDFIEQEYYCSFSGSRSGSYYGKEMVKADHEGRICNLPWEPRIPVFTVWDLGFSDATAIWFCQRTGHEIRLIDYYEASGEGLPHFIKMLRSKGYIYSNHYAPHDIEVHELSSGRSRRDLAFQLGINFVVVPNIPLMDGIDNARATLPRCWFDINKANFGTRCLENYHKEYDEKRQTYKNNPVHDKWSHGADAFRYLCLVADRETDSYTRPLETVTDFEIFEGVR